MHSSRYFPIAQRADKRQFSCRGSVDSGMDWLRTYDLCMYVLLISIGCVWNGTLLVMFARHREIRTTANAMILNLAVCDFVNLVTVAPVRFLYHYPHGWPDHVDICRSISLFQHWILCVSALSVVALSVQRSRIVAFNRLTEKHTAVVTTLYVLLIWIISLCISLPFGVVWQIYEYMCGLYEDTHVTKIMIFVDFTLYCLVMPFLMFSFNLATARRLKESLKNLAGGVNSGSRELGRRRSANVVTVLSVLFVVAHLPYFIWCIYVYLSGASRSNGTILALEYTCKHLLFLNSCFNPMALYLTSSTFRRLFRRYLCCRHEPLTTCFTVQTADP